MSILTSMRRIAGKFKDARPYARNWMTLGLRHALRPKTALRIWVKTPSGAYIWLDEDFVDDIILQHLYQLEELFFPNEVKYNENDLILDLGAHHGLYIIELLVRNPGLKAVCIEPDPWGCELIKKMAAKNKLTDRLEIHNCAIGERSGKGILIQSGDGSWANTMATSGPAVGKTVMVTPLEPIVKGRAFKVIKCNTEGGEYVIIPQVLELGLKPDRMILMTHGNKEQQESLLREVEKAGYTRKLVNPDPVFPGWHLIRNK
jgi:FkbM family methyltransferase